VEGVQSCSAMAQGEGKGSVFRTQVFLLISLFFSLSLSPFFHPLFSFLSRHREGGRERTAVGVQGCRGVQGRPLDLNPASSVVKRLGPLRHSKGPGKLCLPATPTPRISCQRHQQRIPEPYPQQAPQWLGGLLTAQGWKAKPTRRVRAAQSDQSEG
jgi:hypothetical protein